MAKLNDKLAEQVMEALREEEGGIPYDGSSEVDPEKLQEIIDNFRQQMPKSSYPAIDIHWGVYVLAFAVFFSLAGLFGYRLYQSILEKERKKEEKKKLKEAKKKK